LARAGLLVVPPATRASAARQGRSLSGPGCCAGRHLAQAPHGELPTEDAAVLTAEFEADLFGDDQDPGRFAVVSLPPVLLDDAARLTAGHGLQAYDAVQLASAGATRAADPGCATFPCSDELLRAAAAAEGFALVP